MILSFRREELKFKIPATTSRGAYSNKEIILVELRDPKNGKIGIGECSPLPDLSIDGKFYSDSNLKELIEKVNDFQLTPNDLIEFPAFRFAFETAIKDLNTEGTGVLFPSGYTLNQKRIPINGLVWMSDAENMKSQVIDKINKGFQVIKIKIGALDFDEECRLLENVRKLADANKIELRVDANGAFENDFALEKIKDLSRFEIHSIEQPIKQGQWEMMEEVCAKSKIDVALDEELIGVNEQEAKKSLLKAIKPQYVILKPSLLGGFQSCDEWVKISESAKIDWWSTSALESNIGLNAIAQWVSTFPIKMAQGLGTGMLFEENFEMGLKIENGQLYRDTEISKKIDYKL